MMARMELEQVGEVEMESVKVKMELVKAKIKQ